eukprot:gene840-2624_t
MDYKGVKEVAIAGGEDKRMLSLEWGVSDDGDVLPLQFVYKGKTKRSIPEAFAKYKEEYGWRATYTKNHWCTTKTKLRRLKTIVIPYVKAKRKELGLEPD